MPKTMHATAISLFALAATLVMHSGAQAGCKPGTESDVTASTCVGTRALSDNSTDGYWRGRQNTAMGHSALISNLIGSFNVGFGSMVLNSKSLGDGNTAVGYRAGYNRDSRSSTFIGAQSGGAAELVTTGSLFSIAIGYRAGRDWVDADVYNIAIGSEGDPDDFRIIRIGTQGTHTATFIAGIVGNGIAGGQTVVIDGSGRFGVGPAPSGMLLPVIPGDNNIGVGDGALSSSPASGGNTASGVNALQANILGANNVASGHNSLLRNSSGGANTASGVSSLQQNTTGNNNTASGINVLLANTTGSNNAAVGAGAMANNISGSNNIALGFGAGGNLTTGNNNIAIGNAGVSGESNTVRIGSSQSRTIIAGIRNTKVIKGVAVQVDANGQIGTSRSSMRYKEDVKNMGDASSPIMNLRPVTFRYIDPAPDGSKPLQYGLIAEEVEEVMPDLVVHNEQGTPESVDYAVLPSLLLNEYLKQSQEVIAAKAEQMQNDAELADAKSQLADARNELADTKARLKTVNETLVALKFEISRLAPKPSNEKLVGTAP